MRSALTQTVTELEVLIPPRDSPAEDPSGASAWSDPRVRQVSAEAGTASNAFLRSALAAARGEVICYLPGDALWRPFHVEQVVSALDRAPVALMPTLKVHPGGRLEAVAGDLTHGALRAALTEGTVRLPLSGLGHTLACYRQRPLSATGIEDPTVDAKELWELLLTEPVDRSASGERPSSFQFPMEERSSWTPVYLSEERRRWLNRLQSADGSAQIDAEVRAAYVRDFTGSWVETEALRTRVEREMPELTGSIEALERRLAQADERVRQLSEDYEVLSADHRLLSQQRLHLLERDRETSTRLHQLQTQVETLEQNLRRTQQELKDVVTSATWRIKNRVTALPAGLSEPLRRIIRGRG